MPIGRADKKQLDFTQESIILYKNEISKLKKIFKNFIFDAPEYLTKKESSCGAGADTITITPEGDVKICPLSKNDHSIGNIYIEGFIPVLQKIKDFNFSKLKTPNENLCGECEFLFFCYGCIERGYRKYDELKEQCSWGYNYLSKKVNTINK